MPSTRMSTSRLNRRLAEMGDLYAVCMDFVDDGIRRGRRPLPAHELDGVNYRRWAGAVLAAEVKHAVEDFWRCVYDQGAGLRFDHYKRAVEAMPFRLAHEVRASEAYNALGALNLHDGDARGPWSRWNTFGRQRKREWAAERLVLKRRWWAAMARYHEARDAMANINRSL